MATRGRANPLALAVLSCLLERPMHPYEVAQTLRVREKHESIRLNYGSLYGVVEGLEKRGLIHARETVRDGRRPERTVYEITAEGQRELVDWLSELIAQPEKEYLRFEAALSLIGALPPEDALELLRERIGRLERQLVTIDATHRNALEGGLPRIHLIESEYGEALLRAELAYVQQLAKDIEGGGLDGIEEWRSWHVPRGGDAP